MKETVQAGRRHHANISVRGWAELQYSAGRLLRGRVDGILKRVSNGLHNSPPSQNPVGFVAGVLMLFRRKLGSVLFCIKVAIQMAEVLLPLLFTILFLPLAYLVLLLEAGRDYLPYILREIAWLGSYLQVIILVTIDYKKHVQASEDGYVFKLG